MLFSRISRAVADPAHTDPQSAAGKELDLLIELRVRDGVGGQGLAWGGRRSGREAGVAWAGPARVLPPHARARARTIDTRHPCIAEKP